jgi:hypothetical protein
MQISPPKKSQKSSSIGQSMSYPLFQVRRMKHYATRYRRRHLLPVPYSVRPDRIERSLRILRAVRQALITPQPMIQAQQCEFNFAVTRRF